MLESNQPNQVEDARYLTGAVNRLIRYYFYLNKGLDVVNQFRNLILGIVGVYIALELKNWGWLAGMFSISIPVLIVVGYYSVHRISKVSDWLGTRFGSHYSIRSFDYQRAQYELLKEINSKIKKT